jgi:hypothetical protein
MLFAMEGSRGDMRVLKDWELLDRVNPVLRGSLKDVRSLPAAPDLVNAWLIEAREAAQRNIASLGEAFRVPDLADFGVLWPAAQ